MINTNIAEIIIGKVSEPYGWLSCMSAYAIQYLGQSYRTCEAVFQCLRFDGYPIVQEAIRNCPSPMGAKMIARKQRALLNREGSWDEDASDLPRMKMCLELKLEQHPELRQQLHDTGNIPIIEDSTKHTGESKRFWGHVKVNGVWTGENHLGRLWMEIRSELNNQ